MNLKPDSVQTQRIPKPTLWVALFWLVSSAAVLWSTVWLHQGQKTDLRLEFERQVNDITEDLERRFSLAAYGLMGARGVYAASQNVSREEFRHYVESRDLGREFPGIRGIGFIERVPSDQTEVFLQATQADGVPEFTIKKLNDPGLSKDEAFIIKYIEPIEPNRQALGLDVGSEANRRAGVMRALETGQPALTRSIRLLQDQQARPGFLLFVPVYRTGAPLSTPVERLAAARGVAYAPIVLEELLAPAMGMLLGKQLNIQIIEPSPTETPNVLQNIGDTPDAPMFSRNMALDTLGADLRLQFHSLPEFEEALESPLIYALGVAGLLINTLLALVLWQLWSQRERAEGLARQLSQDVDQLSLVAQKTTNVVIITDADMRILWVNQGFTRVSGYTSSDAVGRTPRELLASENTSRETMDQLSRARERGESCRVEILDRAKDGREYWMDIENQPIRNHAGKLTGFIVIGVDLTPAKEREALLIAERQRVENILDGTRAGTWEWHVPSGQTKFNERWAAIIGYSLAELEPVSIDTWVRVCHPDDLQKSHTLLQKHFAGELEFYECESRMRHKAGHWVWVMDRGKVATREADGSPGWMYGTHLDITPRKQTEIALRASEFRLKTLSELSAQWFWESDTEHRLCRFSSGNKELAALLNATARGKKRWEFGLEAIGTTWEQHKEDLEHHRTFNDLIYLKVFDDGSHRYFSVSGAPQYNEHGEFIGYLGTGSDVTQAKESEQRIARSEALLERTGKLAKVGGWRIDLSKGVPEWSPETCRIHEVPVGYAPKLDEALNFFPPEARPIITEMVERGLKTGQGWDVELPFITAKGRHIWVRAFGEAETLDGKPVALVGGIQDITEQRAQADALREAKFQAEQASQFKSQFVANMSHEIRTPMNAVLGMLKLLQSTPLQPRQLDYAQKAESSAKSLLGLLNDILDFSKVEAGKLTLDPGPFVLDHLMRDLAVIYSSYAGGKGVELLFDLDPQLPRSLVGDALRLQQILINLGSNAIKFTPEGMVVLRVNLDSITEDGNGSIAHVRFAVQDNGIGIAPENQDKIFGGFTQAEASTTRRFGGTGLGLAISRRLIEMMGGQLVLESALGQGSTFSFTLPMPIHEVAEVAPPPAPPTRVLMVDDHPMALQLLQRMGLSLGWQLDTAPSGAAALQVIEERQKQGQPFELLFIDCEMPEMDGWELAARTRALYQGAAHRPVIVMVTCNGRDALAQQTDEVRSLLDQYLVKPVTASMLLDTLQHAQRPDTTARLPAPSTGLVSRPLAGLRILVVEDNAVNQQVAEELISGQGASVDIADNGLRGVEALQAAIRDQRPYDVILMDMQMPVMDGITATQEIRQRLGVTDIPIIAMTANAMNTDRERCLQAGMNDHVGKPFELDHLVLTLLNWTRGQQTNAASPNAAAHDGWAPPPPSSSDEAPILDRAGALKRIGGSESLLQRMGTQFLKDLPPLLAACHAAMQDADPGRLQNALHSIKGVASALGADRLAQCAKRGEEATRSGAAADLAGLQAVFEQTRDALLATSVGAPPPKAAETRDTRLSDAERQALVDLQALLHDSDMGVFDALERLQAAGTTDPSRWHSLEDAVEAMNFDAALVLVEQALSA